MLTETHRWIAKQIGGYLKLDERQSALLAEGSAIPDRIQNFPHHTGKIDEIKKCVLKARLMFLEDDDECYYYLGMALHYIQDSWTTKPRVADKHTKWERDIHEIIGKRLIIDVNNFVQGDYQSYGFRKSDWESYGYGIKAELCLRKNRRNFSEKIWDLPIPFKTILKISKVDRLFLIRYELLSYHKEKELLNVLISVCYEDKPFLRDTQYPVITQECTANYIMLGWLLKDPWLHKALKDPESEPLKDPDLKQFFSFIAQHYLKWSLPYVDLYFALQTSLIVSIRVLFPKDISPKDWLYEELRKQAKNTVDFSKVTML